MQGELDAARGVHASRNEALQRQTGARAVVEARGVRVVRAGRGHREGRRRPAGG